MAREGFKPRPCRSQSRRSHPLDHAARSQTCAGGLGLGVEAMWSRSRVF